MKYRSVSTTELAVTALATSIQRSQVLVHLTFCTKARNSWHEYVLELGNAISMEGYNDDRRVIHTCKICEILHHPS